MSAQGTAGSQPVPARPRCASSTGEAGHFGVKDQHPSDDGGEDGGTSWSPETPGSLPTSHPGTEGDPRLLPRGQGRGRDGSVLSVQHQHGPALVKAGEELPAQPQDLQGTETSPGGRLVVPWNLFVTLQMPHWGMCSEPTRGARARLVHKVTSETGQGTETSWFPGQHQQCEDTEIQLYSFSTFLKKSCSRHKDFQLLCKSSSLSQTFCAISAAVSEYPRVPVLSEIPIPALP